MTSMPNIRVLVLQINSAGYTHADIAERLGSCEKAIHRWSYTGLARRNSKIYELVGLRNKLRDLGRVKVSDDEAAQLISLVDKAGLRITNRIVR